MATSSPPSEPSIPEIGGGNPVVEPESIFTSPEEEHTEDLFGTPQRGLVEMPPATTPLQPEPPPQKVSERIPPMRETAATIADTFAAAPAPAPVEGWGHAAPPDSGVSMGEPPSGIRPRVKAKRGLLVPILLIFLIPYALVATGFIAWLLYLQNQRFDPLKMLPDPDSKEGPTERIKHDAPLSKDNRTQLKQAIQIGELQVTPLKIELNADGDLVLHLHMKNTSRDLRFNPLPDAYLRFNRASMTAPRPYTFLQKIPDHGSSRFYGGEREYWKGHPGKGQKTETGTLDPGQEMVTLLHTSNTLGYRAEVTKLAQTPGNWLWRVQVRRGLVQIKGKDIPVTTVIGVEFDSRAVERAGKTAG